MPQYTPEQEEDIRDRELSSYMKGLEKYHSMSPDTRNEFTRFEGQLDTLSLDQKKTERFLSKVAWIVVGLLFGIGAWVATMQSSVKNNTDDIADHRVEIQGLIDNQRSTDVVSAEIKTKLVNIEVTLQEIKQNLKK